MGGSGPGAEAPPGKLRSEVQTFGNVNTQLRPLPTPRLPRGAQTWGSALAAGCRAPRGCGSGAGGEMPRLRARPGSVPGEKAPRAPTAAAGSPGRDAPAAASYCVPRPGLRPVPGRGGLRSEPREPGGAASAPPLAPYFLPIPTWKSSLRGLLTWSLKKRRPQVCAEGCAEAPPGGLQVLFLHSRSGALRGGLEAS